MPLSKDFKELKKNVSKNYLGKPVPKQFQNRYGKKYDKEDITSFSYAIAKSRRIKTH